jgi:hypothetical protein
MINREKAIEIAQRQIAIMAVRSNLDLALVLEDTVEFDLGWIFLWDSKKFLETHDFSEALAGNAPMIVDRRDGSVHQTSTALAKADELIEWYHQQQDARIGEIKVSAR